MSEAITITESQRLVELESKISSGLQTFVEVGEALMEIRDSRLYRVEHGTFEDYCKTKWGMSKRHCDRLISSTAATKNLGPIGPKPNSESQARPLTKLPAEQQPVAWERAVEKAGGEQPTAKQVQEAVVEVLEPDPVHSPLPLDIRAKEISEAANEEYEKVKNDSSKLTALKRAWRSAGKHDRSRFMKWAEQAQA